MNPKDSAIYENLKVQVDKIYSHIRQLSINTRPAYKDAFLRLCKHAAAEYKVQNIRNLSDKHVSSYIYSKIEDVRAATYLMSEMSGIRFTYDQVSNARYKLKATNEELGIPERDPPNKDRTWRHEDISAIKQMALADKRYDVYFCIILSESMGLRLHECFRMTHSNAKQALDKGYLTIKGKGGLIRQIPLDDKGRTALREFLGFKGFGNSRILAGEKKTHLHMGDVEKYIAKTRTDPSKTHHGLRHTYAVSLYKARLGEYIGYGLSKQEAQKKAFWDVNRALGHGKNRQDVTRRYLCSVL